MTTPFPLRYRIVGWGYRKDSMAHTLFEIQLDAAFSAETLSRDEEDRTAGVLNLIKAVKELEGMDLNNLAQKISLLKALEGKQEEKEQEIASDASAEVRVQ